MLRRTLSITLAIGALVAFAVPAIASADVLLREGEEALATGAEVTATSPDFAISATTGTFSCGLVTLHLEVTANGPTHVTLTQLGAITTEHFCVFDAGGAIFPASVTDWTLGELTIDTWGTGKATMGLAVDIPAAGVNCPLEGNLDFEPTSPGSDSLSLGPSILAGEPPACPSEATVEGEFTLETEDGTPVLLDFQGTDR